MSKIVVEENNYWPAFVDALSTIVLVVTFLVIILGLAIFEISQKYQDSVRSEILAEMNKKPHVAQGGYLYPPESGYASMGENTGKGSAEVEEPKGNLLEAKYLRNRALRQETRIVPSDALLTIDYGADAIEMDETSIAVAENVLGALGEYQQGRFEIIANSHSDLGSVSEAKRTAYYRLMSLRAFLIDKGVPAENIDFRVEYRSDERAEKQEPLVRVYYKD